MGDEVYAYNEEEGQVVVRSVVHTFQRQAEELIDLTVRFAGTDADEVLSGTPEHPFFVPSEGDYVAMRNLSAGTILRTEDGIRARVVSVSRRRGSFAVFNFEVEDAHNYFVSSAGTTEAGVLVHNDCFDAVRAANNLPRNARLTTNEADVFRRLSQHHGIDPRVASERLHTIGDRLSSSAFGWAR